MSICIREARISDSEFIWELNCQEMGYVYPLEDTTERINSILFYLAKQKPQFRYKRDCVFCLEWRRKT